MYECEYKYKLGDVVAVERKSEYVFTTKEFADKIGVVTKIDDEAFDENCYRVEFKVMVNEKAIFSSRWFIESEIYLCNFDVGL